MYLSKRAVILFSDGSRCLFSEDWLTLELTLLDLPGSRAQRPRGKREWLWFNGAEWTVGTEPQLWDPKLFNVEAMVTEFLFPLTWSSDDIRWGSVWEEFGGYKHCNSIVSETVQRKSCSHAYPCRYRYMYILPDTTIIFKLES